MDYIDVALKYGGFTSLDRVYLARQLEDLTDSQKLAFITPPPSVINAYFAELYQKKSPQAATDYYLTLSKRFNLFIEHPSFREEKPFVRLNLSGKAFGFAYQNDRELARVFAEEYEPITPHLLFEIAQIFPHYKVFVKEEVIWMKPLAIDEGSLTAVETSYLLTDLAESAEWVRVSGLNQEEVIELVSHYQGQAYYAWSGRTAIVYLQQ
ncbi:MULTISPECIES: cystathionine beta-lyase [unclassified Streptococcus]|uniref:cystathionine beta-lyase n=1 Tax=unclassified Streptococcus TaxID=2608887 RepID=UPI00107223FA|nr:MULTISPECIES: cystathionine beta-lyase [unclassified Streptococcus]MBF0786569.1 cystathionine beta-lyase [Streptococcus sp. 19428wC2_LYSM12]MCQ9210938.1 cystathionine beta-lyase [Streptococcus sp. B01]MCQ9214207.1 cystathionine beta-lyase [Streptococcus sp. O1]TFV06532.1 cystathionine beta-lyase [Streptococcus sp. LYSM12]